MRASELGRTAPLRVALVNPPVVVLDPAQLDRSVDGLPFGLLQIAGWLRAAGHEVTVADMVGPEGLRYGWKDLISRRGLVLGIGKLPSGAPGLELDYWLYGKPPEWLDAWLGALEGEPDEVWFVCESLSDAFVARMLAKMVRRCCPAAAIRLGGEYAARFPEHAASFGADEVFGRLAEAEATVPEVAVASAELGLGRFRLTAGGAPAEDGGAGGTPARELPAGEVIDSIERAAGELGVRHFESWDPDILRFRVHLGGFLQDVAERGLDVDLGFEHVFDPTAVDEYLGEQCAAARVRAVALPLGTADPRLLALSGTQGSVVSSIRALSRLRSGGLDLSWTRGTLVFGYPDEALEDVLALFHVALRFGLVSSPTPVVPSPGSPAAERYRDRVAGRRFAERNGHLFPLVGDPKQILLYRRLLHLLRAKDDLEAEHIVGRMPGVVVQAYDRGRRAAERLVEVALGGDEADGPELLERVRS